MKTPSKPSTELRDGDPPPVQAGAQPHTKPDTEPAETDTDTEADHQVNTQADHRRDADKDATVAPGSDNLEVLRQRIDVIDRQLLKLLNERASVVVEVGNIKRNEGVPIYAPHREAEVLAQAIARNSGPLSGRTIEGIYRELMSGSFLLEQPLRIGYLGPPGTFSHAAACIQFGSSVEYEQLDTIGSVFDSVRRQHVDYGVVPIENSTGGSIFETMDAFLDSAETVTIYSEVLIAIRHQLLANCSPTAIRRIYSKPEVFSQCRKWLSGHYPRAELIAAPSTSRAAQMAAEYAASNQESGGGEVDGIAAIGSDLAGRLYGLQTLFAGIEDNPNNVTRFFVIAGQSAQRSGDDKTSMMFRTDDKPGALVRVLSVFDRAEVNLTHIDKRPSGTSTWDYTFFIDAVGHRDDANMTYVLREAAAHCRDLTVLGSYPRAKRVL